MAIIIRLSGGLGNQMFQYALGRRLSLKRKSSLWLSKAFYTPSKHRRYELPFLNIRARLLPDRLGGWLNEAYLTQDKQRIWPGLPIFREHGAFGFHPEVMSCPKTAYFGGHWQSYKYFEDVADLVRREFQLCEPITDDRARLADHIKAHLTVAVHVRRGDYLDPKAAHIGPLPASWYHDAMARMAERVVEPQFVIFSEDIAWARENLPSCYNTLFVDPQSDGRAVEDMHLISFCKHQIIANGTFSWWGAWLNPSVSKQVIAPRQWFAGAPSDIEDRIPPSWTLL